MAKYEVHIPAAVPDSQNVTLRVFADNWMAALKSGMEKVGEQGSQMANILCDILEDGTVDVTDPKTGRVFRIKELEGSDEATPISVATVAPQGDDFQDEQEEKTDPNIVLPEFGERAESRSDEATQIGEGKGGEEDEEEETPTESEQPVALDKPVAPEMPRKARPKLSVVPQAPAPRAPKHAPAPAERDVLEEPTPKPIELTPKKPVAPAARAASRLPSVPDASLAHAGRQLTKAERPRLVEQIDEPSEPIRGPIGRKSVVKPKDPEEVYAELFERVQEAESMDRPAALYFFLDLALSKISAESGSVLVAPLGASVLRFAAARGPKSEELLKLNPKVPLGKGIAGFCTQESVALAISDAQRDKRFLRQISEKVGYETRSMICAPLAAEGKTYGCLQIINKNGNAHFEDSELAILSYVAHQAAKYLESHGGA